MTEDQVLAAVQAAAREAFNLGLACGRKREMSEPRMLVTAVQYAEQRVLPVVQLALSEATEAATIAAKQMPKGIVPSLEQGDEGHWGEDGVLTLYASYYDRPDRVALALDWTGDAVASAAEVAGWTSAERRAAAEWALSVMAAAVRQRRAGAATAGARAAAGASVVMHAQPARQQGKNVAAAAVTASLRLMDEHLRLWSLGYSLRTMRHERRARAPGEVFIRLTWRGPEGQSMRRAARLTLPAADALERFLFGR